MKSKGLGRGLKALIPTVPEGTAEGDEIIEIPLERIEPGPFQARQDFNEAALDELAASIKAHGVMQPVVVRPLPDGRYQLIIGERRWRACQRLGKETIPAVVKMADDLSATEMMLIENVQREDLNPLEEANAYRRLIEEFRLTQEEIALRVGKSRSFIANLLRLLQLPLDVQELLENGILSAGHGKALLGLSDPQLQRRLAREIAERGLSVRETEKAVRRLTREGNQRASETKKSLRKDSDIVDIENQLMQLLGTRVRISSGKRGGKIEIEFYSSDELTRLLEWFLNDIKQ